MALSDYYPELKGWTEVHPSGEAAPQIPDEKSQVSPFLRATLPLPLQYQPDTLRQYHRPGLSSFRIAPQSPSSFPAINSAASAVAASVVRSTSSLSSVLLETNGQSNLSQNILNLIQGPGITLSSDTTGGVTITGSGGAAYFAYGGDGSDGVLTFDGTTTVLGLVPASNTYLLTRDIFGINITVNSGVTIKTANWAIFATGTVTVNGTIHNNSGAGGNGGQAGPGGSGSGGGGNAGGGAASGTNPGNAGHFTNPPASLGGGAGGAGTATVGTQAAAPANGNSPASGSMVDLLGVTGPTGAGGGAGGTGASGAGGATRGGGTGLNPSGQVGQAQTGRNPTNAILGASCNNGAFRTYQPSNGGSGAAAGGSGGGGDGTNLGGGGGGGGGIGGTGGLLLVSALTIIVGASGTISANGGAGGPGGNGGSPLQGNTGGGGGGAGGSGGTGGIVWLIYHALTNNGTISANGGTGGARGTAGTGFGTGTAGANGTAGPNGLAGNLIQMVV